MKKLLLLLLLIGTMVSCSYLRKPEPPKVKDDFLKIPEYKTEAPKETPSTTVSVTPVTTVETNDGTGPSYWWVIGEDQDGKVGRSDVIMQEHSYFSYKEACQHFKDESKKDFYIHNFVKIDKETYEHNKDQ